MSSDSWASPWPELAARSADPLREPVVEGGEDLRGAGLQEEVDPFGREVRHLHEGRGEGGGVAASSQEPGRSTSAPSASPAAPQAQEGLLRHALGFVPIGEHAGALRPDHGEVPSVGFVEGPFRQGNPVEIDRRMGRSGG